MYRLLRLVVGASIAAVLLGATGCVIPDISTGSEDAGSSAAAAAAEDSGTPAAATVQGVDCTAVTSTISLCKYISSCPNLVLNAQVFPQCGFRIHGNAIDPECVCGTYLCPIGVPTTCDEATQETSGDTSYDSVCEQSVEGSACKQLGTGTPFTGSSNSTCQTCIENCDNVPSCVDSCGC